jgi:hypothetical protein
MKRFFFYALALLLTAGCAYEISSNEAESSCDGSGITVIRARFEQPDTKSRLSMNAAGTYASVLWTAGDAIQVIGALSGGTYYPKQFTTADDGVTNADFACTGWNPSSSVTRYYGFYPASEYKGYYDDALGVCIPSVQQAKAGGIQEGLNRAYAVASTMSDGLTFKNIPALVKFRLSGAVVSSLKSIKFIGTSTLAGDIALQNLSAGEPVYNSSAWIGSHEEDPSSVIELKGPFTTGVDYYIVMFPGVSNGFSMIFQNASGDYIIKESTKKLTLTRSHIVDFGTINVGSSFGDPAVTKYKTATSGLDPVDLVVLPDGYTASQRGTFESRAASAIDFLFETEPYKTYKNYFNVYFIWKPSEEEGASICNSSGVITTARNTAFGSYWEADAYDHMSADEDAVFGFVQAHCPEIVRGEKTIAEVPVLLLINDSRYGGIAHTYSNGQTYCQVPYTDNGGSLGWSYSTLVPASDNPADGFNTTTLTSSEIASRYGTVSGDWRNVVVHEFGGHSFGRLADEYWYTSYPGSQSDIGGHSYPVPFGLNVSGWYDDAKLPWKELLSMRSSLVTSNSLYSRIGKFQGGDVYIFNRWRSEEVSCMIDNRPYFSAWQRALIAKRIMELAGGSFSLSSYMSSKDKPEDPVRDMISSPVIQPSTKANVPIMPMLPPPVLIDNTPKSIR